MKAKVRVDDFVREMCKSLETVYDAEALNLLSMYGVFGDEPDADALEGSIERILETEGRDHAVSSDRILELQHIACDDKDADKRRQAVLELEEMEMKETAAVRTAAYMLGIAMGRRIGPAALVLPAAQSKKPVPRGGVR